MLTFTETIYSQPNMSSTKETSLVSIATINMCITTISETTETINMRNRFKQKSLALLFSGICISTLFSPTQTFATTEKTLVINSGSSVPLAINNDSGFYMVLIQELFDRLKIKVKTIHLPSSRSLKNVAQGIDDGVIARVKGIEKKSPNLIRVPEKVIDLEFVAYTNDANIKIEKWSDLKPYNVAYIRGWKIFDKNVTAYKSLVRAKDSKQMIGLLKNHRVDVVLYQDIPAKYILKKMDYHPHKQTPALASREMYIYMHKRHIKLVPLIQNELKKIKSDGTYNSLYKQHIADIISP